MMAMIGYDRPCHDLMGSYTTPSSPPATKAVGA